MAALLVRWVTVGAVLGALAGCSERTHTSDSDLQNEHRPDDDAQKSSVAVGKEPTAKGSTIILDLGAVTKGRIVDLDVPKSAIGFNITVTSGGQGSMGVEKITNPRGEPVLEAFTPIHGTLPSALGIDGMGSAS